MNQYRKGVGIFLLNSEKKLWIGKRIDVKSTYWQMPQGGIDNKETPMEAMRRELMEEVGIIKNYRILSESKEWLKYDLPKKLIKMVWNGKYIGQRQKWFACEFLGDDEEIQTNKYSNPEFDKWQWIKPHHILEKVVPFKRKMYSALLDNFVEFYN